MKRSSANKWPTKVDYSYQPKISVIVPTFNEAEIILLKLQNLSLLDYPADLIEIAIVDSNSSDNTVRIVESFKKENPDLNIKVFVEEERKGKSHALNYALERCSHDVIIVSDADCFWPSNILKKSMPFFADQVVGLIGGPKLLLNSAQTWVTRMEEKYLRSANILRLGESKVGSTVFFEGGFSAFKKQALQEFDPFCTGSDDCGSAIGVLQKGFRAMLVPEAKFYTTFPASLRNKLSVKTRRINQLVRVFAAYLRLIFAGQLNSTRITIIPNALLYLVSPTAFIVFLALTAYLSFSFPFLLSILLLLLIPKIGFYSYQLIENNFLLFFGVLGVLAGKNFSIWSKPEDRLFLSWDVLTRLNLVQDTA